MDSAHFDQFEPLLAERVGAPLRVGVLGASRIVPQALAAAFSEPDFCVRVTALGARSLTRAQAFGRELSIERAYGSYDELINDPDVEAVYVATPCSEHASLSIRALRAKKHVLCEKPFALSLVEANAVLAVAREERRLVMEAHHWRYHALVERASGFIKNLGALRAIETTFLAGVDDAQDIRRNPLLGPGVTMDFGCYCLQWACWAAACSRANGIRAEDVSVRVLNATMQEEGQGIDVALSALLSIDGIPTRIHCDMRAKTPFFAQVKVEGSHGLLEFENPLAVEGAVLRFRPSSEGLGAGLNEVDLRCETGSTTYREQLKAFVHALRSGEPPVTSGKNITTTQGLLDSVYDVAGLPSRAQLRETALLKQ